MVIQNAQFDNFVRLLTLMFDCNLILIAIVILFSIKVNFEKNLFIFFFIISTITFIVNISAVQMSVHFNGIREPLVLLSSLIIIKGIFLSNYKDYFIKVFTRFIFIFVVLQLPTAIWEFSIYGAADEVGGTYGTRGGTGFIALLLFSSVFYLIIFNTKIKTDFKIKNILKYSMFLFPLALNETKITFILIFFYILCIVKIRRNIFSTFLIMSFSLIMFWIWYSYYLKTVGDLRVHLFERDFLYDSLLVNNSNTGGRIGRLALISELYNTFRDDISKVLLGLGYGIFKGGNIIDISQVGSKYFYLWKNSKSLFFIAWIQGGLIFVGFILFLMYRYLINFKKKSIPFILNRFRIFLFLEMIIMLFYNGALLTRIFAVITSYYLIWVSSYTNLDNKCQNR